MTENPDLSGEAFNGAVVDTIESGVECPSCSSAMLVVELRLAVKPLGTYSLAGMQPKVAATTVPWIKCPQCGIEASADKQR